MHLREQRCQNHLSWIHCTHLNITKVWKIESVFWWEKGLGPYITVFPRIKEQERLCKPRTEKWVLKEWWRLQTGQLITRIVCSVGSKKILQPITFPFLHKYWMLGHCPQKDTQNCATGSHNPAVKLNKSWLSLNFCLIVGKNIIGLSF